MASNTTVQLSAQEVVSCDESQNGCEGGYVNKVLNWGKKKGFITEQCLSYTGSQQECEVDHLESNECRVDNNVWRVQDYCISFQEENIKREIVKNGPVVSQMVPYTDFLAYKSGMYHRTQDSFKFNGQHIVKIVGWSRSMDGRTEWIVENTWGEDWGEDGYARMLGGQGDSQVDLYTIGPSVLPYNMYDYHSMQNMMDAANEGEEGQEDEEEINMDELEQEVVEE